MPRLRSIVIVVAIAAASLAATAGGAGPGDPALDRPGHSDVALRPTAVEYAVML